MFLRQRAQRLGDAVQIARDQVQRLTQLQDTAGVDGVLAGSPPMHKVRGLFVFLGDERRQMLYERDSDVSRAASSLSRFGPLMKGSAMVALAAYE